MDHFGKVTSKLAPQANTYLTKLSKLSGLQQENALAQNHPHQLLKRDLHQSK